MKRGLLIVLLLSTTVLGAGCVDVNLMRSAADIVVGEPEVDDVFRSLYNISWAFETALINPLESTHFEDAGSFRITKDNIDPYPDPRDGGRELFTMTVVISFVREDSLSFIEEIFSGSGVPSRRALIELESPDGQVYSYPYTPGGGDFSGSITLTSQLQEGVWHVRVEADGVGVGQTRDQGSVLVGALFFEEV